MILFIVELFTKVKDFDFDIKPSSGLFLYDVVFSELGNVKFNQGILFSDELKVSRKGDTWSSRYIYQPPGNSCNSHDVILSDDHENL